MLVIHRNGRRNHKGSGMFSAIAKKLLSGGVSAISRGASSAMMHKVGDAVVKGAATTSKRVADAVIQEAANTAGKATARAVNATIDSFVDRVRKRPAPPPEPIVVKRRKIIDSVIDGSGIVYD